MSKIKSIQQTQLQKLLSKAASTQIGRRYRFNEIHSYEDYCTQVPLHTYEDLKSKIDLIKQGETDIFWPGSTHKFAVSAGTTGDGKHLPLSKERIASDNRFSRKVIFSYLKQRPNILSLLGKHISLPGSLETIRIQNRSLLLGEISGFLAMEAPALLRPFQLVGVNRLTRLSFSEKFNLVLTRALKSDIRVITAVPSWILTLFQQALHRTGKQSIAEIWPNLKLLVCGGVKLAHYRDHLKKLCGDIHPDFIETYGASEGYFAFADNLDKTDLKLVTGNGLFYEWIAHPSPDLQKLKQQKAIPSWKIETGIPYALVITNNSGLWRYVVNDIIEFTSVNPPRLLVKGRLSEMLDDYGEALYSWEAEKALKLSCKSLNLDFDTFTLAGHLDGEHDIPRHLWFIQFNQPPTKEHKTKLARELDKKLQQINRHYAIRRESNALEYPLIYSITQQHINHWFQQTGKHSAQRKLPRVLHSSESRQKLLAIIKNTTDGF